MVRVKQFADDLGISKNKAQALINKGRSRKDGGSQILENVMKPKGYKPGGSVTKTKTNPKAPIAKVKKTTLKKIVKKDSTTKDKTESLDKEFSKQVAQQNEDAKKNVKRNAGGSINKNIVSIDVDKTPGNLSTQKKIQSAIKGKSLKTSDVNKMTNNDIKPLLKKKNGGAFPDLTGDGKTTQADILKGRGVPGFSRGGGIAIQGLGFKGVR